MASKLFQQEAVMGQVIPKQHPAVVLRSHYKAVRALLAAALVAVVALAATVVILANDDNDTTIAAPKAAVQQQLPAGTRFDGGPDEGTRGIQAEPVAPGTRFDGGPEEGTRGPHSLPQSASPLATYQAPDDDSAAPSGGPRGIPMGPGH